MPVNKKIPDHEKQLFAFQDVSIGATQKYIKTYFHEIKDMLPYHTHDFYEINIVASGAGTHLIGEKEIITQRGDVFVIPPYMKHGYLCNKEMVVYHILLSNRFMAMFSNFMEQLPGYKMLFNIEPILRGRIEKAFYLRAPDISFSQLKQYMEMIGQQSSDRESGNEYESTAHVLSLIATLSRTISVQKPLHTESLSDAYVLTLIESIEYLETHFDQRINYKDVAKKSALSYNNYLKQFKKLTGITPSEYLTNYRVKNAMNLLLNTDETVLSVALSCGFYDSSHFIRCFSRLAGISPAEFRRKNKIK